GTGKSVVARVLHHSGPRRERRFERVRASALPESVLEVELFGAPGEAGAVERAEGGTLFVDEVDQAPPGVQARLLRLLQERRFARSGESQERRAHARPPAARRRAPGG